MQAIRCVSVDVGAHDHISDTLQAGMYGYRSIDKLMKQTLQGGKYRLDCFMRRLSINDIKRTPHSWTGRGNLVVPQPTSFCVAAKPLSVWTHGLIFEQLDQFLRVDKTYKARCNG